MQVKFARTILAGAALAVGFAVATPAVASAQMGFLVQGNYSGDFDIGVGGGVSFGLGSLTTNSGIRAEATFDYYFPGDELEFWEINGNALMDIKSVPGLYVGAGAHYYTFGTDACGDILDDLCDDSGIGLNVLGGWNFAGSKGPFVQAKLGLAGAEHFVVSAGIRF